MHESTDSFSKLHFLVCSACLPSSILSLNLFLLFLRFELLHLLLCSLIVFVCVCVCFVGGVVSVGFCQDHLIDGETLYIATDERNRSFFEAFHERFKVRFLSDYYEKAGVSEMGPNYVGMIEQV